MPTGTHTTVFDRVVSGVDHSEAGAAAARAAGLLTSAEGSLLLLAVDDASIAVHAGWAMPRVLEELAEEAQAALDRARAEAEPLHRVKAKLVKGDPSRCLLAEIARSEATLVAVGSHGLSRAAGVALGSVATHLLHEAPCTVLVVRGPVEVGRWPQTIVVGVDGSADSERALDVARAVAARFGAEVRVVTATRGHVDVDAARRIAPELEEHDARALDALGVAAEAADLLVLGSRGLQGMKALGSVSERAAHRVACSALIVRERGGAG